MSPVQRHLAGRRGIALLRVAIARCAGELYNQDVSFCRSYIRPMYGRQGRAHDWNILETVSDAMPLFILMLFDKEFYLISCPWIYGLFYWIYTHGRTERGGGWCLGREEQLLPLNLVTSLLTIFNYLLWRACDLHRWPLRSAHSMLPQLHYWI